MKKTIKLLTKLLEEERTTSKKLSKELRLLKNESSYTELEPTMLVGRENYIKSIDNEAKLPSYLDDLLDNIKAHGKDPDKTTMAEALSLFNCPVSMEDMKVKKVVKLKGEIIESELLERPIEEEYGSVIERLFLGYKITLKVDKKTYEAIYNNHELINNHDNIRFIKLNYVNGDYIVVVKSKNEEDVKELFNYYTKLSDLLEKTTLSDEDEIHVEHGLKTQESARVQFIKFLKDEGVYDEYMKLNDNRAEGFEDFNDISDAGAYFHFAFDWVSVNYEKWSELNTKWLKLVDQNNIKE